MSHSKHNRSFQRRVFPGNQLHWYRQPKNKHYKHHKHKRITGETCPSWQIKLSPGSVRFLWPPVRNCSGPYSYDARARVGHTRSWSWTVSLLSTFHNELTRHFHCCCSHDSYCRQFVDVCCAEMTPVEDHTQSSHQAMTNHLHSSATQINMTALVPKSYVQVMFTSNLLTMWKTCCREQTF